MRPARLLALAGLALAALLVPATADASGVPADPLAYLGRNATVAGTAWWRDPATGQVVVAADGTVGGAELSRLTAAVHHVRGALVREPGVLAKHTAGGDPFYTSMGRCAIGFNARSSTGVYYFLTSAHCVSGVGGTVWADAGHTVVLGTVVAASPGSDTGVVRYTNDSISKPGTVNLYNGSYVDITGAGNAYVGQSVKRAGPTTGVHSGTVQALNVTVNYAEGTVYGLIKTNVCAEAGDSGGPLWSGTTALGTLSGGSGNCASGGTTFYAPVTGSLSAWGLTIY